ncbi:DUF4145 domain-containing protein [Carnobacterium divergens]|uniref:DUF4145 domain-containing protein n=1 Tax=Carnobacterium divergens TaxID=2748 RepID=UPI0039BDC653
MPNFDINWEIYNSVGGYRINDQPAFICPHCELRAAHKWTYAFPKKTASVDIPKGIQELIIESCCLSCDKQSYWKIDELGNEELLYPINKINIPSPNEDMPENVRKTYVEAFTILNDSPRAATALARLAVEELLISLRINESSINNQIAKLVEQGLSKKVQQALDALRVVGNNAVHPGKIENLDNEDSAKSILGLINFIVEELITKPKEIEELYANLPKTALAAIEKRDS